MKFRILTGCVLLVGPLSLLTAQSNPIYVQFSPSPVKGALYRPDQGPGPHVAVLLMHRTSNLLSNIATRELSRRGFLVLAMNPRFDNNEALVEWEKIALDVKSGVEYLKGQPGITRVILYAGSGGGPTMSFYQAVAEQGPDYCRGPKKLIQCGEGLEDLPPADGIVFRDAHPGNSVNALRGLNPAVIEEGDPSKISSRLDPYNPKNGFRPDGASSYSESFKKEYFRAQAARMNHLIDTALERLRRIQTGKGPYPDDDAFVITRAVGGRLLELDPSIHHRTLRPQRLLKNDGTIVTQIVESVRPPLLGRRERNASFGQGARFLTLRSFLSANAIRATDSMEQIEWCSSNNSTPCAIQNISVPVLIAAMGGYYFVRDNEIHYELAVSRDKEFIVIDGATHGVTPCTECETTPGQYSNTVRNFFDYVASWINARF